MNCSAELCCALREPLCSAVRHSAGPRVVLSTMSAFSYLGVCHLAAVKGWRNADPGSEACAAG